MTGRVRRKAAIAAAWAIVGLVLVPVAGMILAWLDPPPGLRARWLDEQLEQHDFLLLLFYRGRW